ncbi:hypothetical protein A9K55_003015 [Cordyceps militaris]|uniref:Uncharacterized protein n=1 Tax=Cordyceps militaris TaxID=73501 RepID=A0A2H4S763_CORMI|nr:hypothetical protein A9K55_003015 [Cordyceps militaris]
MAPVLPPLLRRAFAAVTAAPLPSATIPSGASDGPLGDATRLQHAVRSPSSTTTHDPSAGVLDPHDISNVGFFVLFALLGVTFVVGGIWFFFWARNGGFHFKQNDWEDYKTAVLRRRGPNGTLLSGATKSTDLGGGSVYKDVADDGKTTITESTGLSGITAGASDIAAREKREEKRRKRQREREQRKNEKKSKKPSEVSNSKSSSAGEYDEKKHKRRVGGDGEVQDEAAELKARDELRNYRHEKAARVGGLNKQSEGSSWDGSNPTTSHTGTESELLPNKQSTPTSTPTKDKKRSGAAGAIRKVYSTTDREPEKSRPEPKRIKDEGRSTHRRKFSFQATDSLLSGTAEGSGSRSEATSAQGSELGTKSYHHSRPEISRVQREREREERRARRGGYRRGQGDDEL